MADRVGQQFGNYHLVRLLGRGGQAEVYLGEHRYLKSCAALKVLHTSLDAQHSKQFLAEAQTLARLVHPSIVRVLDFTVEQGTPVLIMDYSPAGTMRQRYPLGICLPLATVVSAVSQVTSALHYAHTHHVIHRDVKPENLLLSSHDEVLLSDFGLSVFVPAPELLSTQAMAGTLPYMAPEQLQGHPCFASDQYSLAIVAYEWLTGKRPFRGSQWQLIQQQLYAAPSPLREHNPAVPPAVEAVVLRALAKDPRERYVSVQDFAQALARVSPKALHTAADTEGTAPFRLAQAQLSEGASLPSDHNTQPFPSFASHGFARETQMPFQTRVPSSHYQRRTEQTVSPNKDASRQRLLAKVRAFWITDVLEQSLHGAALLALGLREQPDALAHPWHLVIEAPGEPGRALPPGTSIAQVYDEALGELLILGEPGSGKTTLLLELARTLLSRAEADERHPMPVVFNLSSWAVRRQPLDLWLVEELNTKYQVPRKLGKAWVEADQILPLLDGLDEVAPSARSACVEAINVSRLEHGLVPTVLCSRSAEYLAENTHVLLRKAVVVQPLMEPQIEDYLACAGKAVASVRAALQEDAALRELARTPLMLSVLTLAYHGTSADDLQVTGPPLVRRRHVFAHYVERMLSRRGIPASSPVPSIKGWLAWLARQMKQQNQTIFYIEHLQPDWLSGERMRQIYDRWAVQFPAIFIGMLVSLTISLVLFSPLPLPFSLVAENTLLGGFIGWSLLAGRSAQWDERSARAKRGTAPRLVGRLRGGGLMALGYGLGAVVNVGLEQGAGPSYWLVAGVINGLSVGLGSILLQVFLERSQTTAADVQARPPAQEQGWRPFWQQAGIRNGLLAGLILGLGAGMGAGVAFGLTDGMAGFGLRTGLIEGLGAGISVGVNVALVSGLSAGLLNQLLSRNPRGISPADELRWSWRSLRRSLFAWRHLSRIVGVSVFAGLLYGLSLWPLYVIYRQNSGTSWLDYGLAAGTSLGLISWLVLGLFEGVASETIADEQRVAPNQGIHRSARNGLVLGLISAGIAWLIIGMFAAGYGWTGWLITALCVGLLAGFLNGGLAALRHGVLRFLLWRADSIPRNYPHFLDDATERILLRKVGGGYIFVHRLLLEYFADLETGSSSTEAAESRNTVLPPRVTPSAPMALIGAEGRSDVPAAQLPPALAPVPALGPRLLPCGHEWRLNARFCSICGAPVPS